MNRYIQCKPPVHMINGIPASKAGEWPGIKPNKFPNSKRIILVKGDGIFFGDKDIQPIKKKKLLNYCSSDEWIFRPGTKKITPLVKKEKNFLFTDQFPPVLHGNNNLMNREYDFQKREEYYIKKQKEFNERMSANILANKNNLDIKKDNIIRPNSNRKKLSKEFYENISNNKILGVRFNKDLHKEYKDIISGKNNKSGKKKKALIKSRSTILTSRGYYENKKIIEELIKKENYKKDVNYVLSLNDWESKQKK